MSSHQNKPAVISPALPVRSAPLFRQISELFALVRFSHAIFALPFALTSFLVALSATNLSLASRIALFKALAIIAAVLFARNAAMAFNRICDRQFDAKNPRTSSRHLVTGAVSMRTAWIFFVANVMGFMGICFLLNPLSFYLGLPTLGVLLLYSVTKRFTAFTHFFLGFALGLAPMGAWVAVTGKVGLEPVPLALTVLFWVAGFDIIYATQDEASDRQQHLHSIVVKFGRKTALWLARALHAFVPIGLFLFGWYNPILGWAYYTGCAVITILLFYEHSLVRPESVAANELERINAAFFRVNAVVSLTVLLSTLLSLWEARG